MKPVHTLVITMALGAGLLLPSVSQAHVNVHLAVGLPAIVAAPVVVAPAPVVVTEAAPVVVTEPAPVVLAPPPVHYVEGPRFAPAPEHWHNGPGPRDQGPDRFHH